MELTKQRMLLGGIATAGLIALLVDRTLLTPNDTTLAVPASQANGGAQPATQAGGKLTLTAATSTIRTAQQLDAHRAHIEGPTDSDPFAMPEGWTVPTRASVTAPASAPAESLESRLARSFRLTAISAKPTPTAIINGRALRSGTTARVKIDGRTLTLRLLSVEGPDRTTNTPGSALVEIDGRPITLSIAPIMPTGGNADQN